MDKVKVSKKVLLFVAVFILLVPSVFALYMSGILSNGNLALAGWNVSLNQANVHDLLAILPDPNGTTDSYTLHITSNSEVDATYTIVVDDVPDDVSVSLDGGAFVAETDNQVVFSNVGTILYTDAVKTRDHILSFKAASTADIEDNQEINVNIIVKQLLPS